MSSVRIQTGATERIEALVLDGSLTPLTSKTDILVSVRRWSDGFFLDWNDDTFKSSGWTTRQQAMTEVSAANAPGEYQYDFDTSAITNPAADDTYEVRVDQSPGTDAKNLPQVGEIKVGQFVDDIDAAVSSRAAPGDEMALVDNAIEAGKFDESTAFPLKADDSGATQVARTGADGDTLETLSDQLDVAQADLDNPAQYQADVSLLALEATAQSILADTDAMDTRLPSDPADQSAVELAIANSEAAIRGVDSDTLKSLSDQLDVAQADLDNPSQYQADVSLLALEANVEGHVTAALNLYDPPTKAELDLAVAPLALEANVQGHAADALTAYDPPTRAEATSDKNEILADTTDIQSRLPAALVGGRMDSDVGNLQAAALTQINTQLEVTSGHGAGSWQTGGAGLTQQQVRDAMKLAPTGGAPAAGSVDEHLDDILADTAVMEPLVSANLDATISSVVAAIAALNDLSIADIQTALTNQGYTVGRAALLDNLNKAITALNDLSIGDVQTALTNQGYTVARAALLSNLDASISSVLAAIAALNDLSQADVQAAMTAQGYTTVRAVLLDNLNATISSVIAAVAATEANIRGGSDTLDSLSDQLDTAQADLDNPDQYKANVSALALETTAQAIKAKTDNLPADPASETNATTNKTEIIAAVDENEVKIDALQASLTAAATDITLIRKVETGRWRIDDVTNTMIFYDNDNVTPLLTFALKDVSGLPSAVNIFERDPV